MFCHINYQVDKKLLRDYFFENFEKARHHKTAGSEIPYWLKLFGGQEIVNPVLKDLGIEELNTLPRFSYQYKNTRLYPHIDIDRIVGININLMEGEMPTIHLNREPYAYECALLDVGTILHSVESVPYDRLVLKIAIREPWEKIFSILKNRNLIIGNDCDSYISELTEENKKFVKL